MGLHLHHHIRNHQHHIRNNQRDTPTPRQKVVIPRYEDKRRDKEPKKSHARNEERSVELKRVVIVRSLRDDVGAGDAYAEEDVEHGAAEAGGEAHDGGEDGYAHVGDEVGE